jgi:GGDEF domain-containing protein
MAPALALISVAVIVFVARTLRPQHRQNDERLSQASFADKIEGRRRHAILDDTTGLYTRWYFERRVKEEAARCRRYAHSMAIVVLRVDEVDLTTFSTDGWQKRSQSAAERAAITVREVDIAAALSPFEYAICLVHCDRNGANAAVERIARQLHEYRCEAGVAIYPEEALEPKALVDVARARLNALSPARAA